MLCKYLYNLCKLIMSSYYYNNDSAIFETDTAYINYDIYESILQKNIFLRQWNQKLNHSFHDLKFKYNYEILNQNSQYLKIKLSLIKSFKFNSSQNNIVSSSIDDYLLIIHYTNSFPYLILMICQEEDPEFYYMVSNSNVNQDFIKNINLNKYLISCKTYWINKFQNINKLFNNFSNKASSLKLLRNNSTFNINDACTYAEKYALAPNPDYKNYDDIGGDCTNFVSQIIHAGGINLTSNWKPYTHSWIRVEELYNYLISNNLGKKSAPEPVFSKGTIIQFYTPQKGHYFHSGFVTHILPNNEALYCCHSYNKLNYPLSIIYPVLYPSIRCININ